MGSLGDDAVNATNDDATMCKFQAVEKGYFKDNYIHSFVTSKAKNVSARKAPEINRGYYARTASVTYLVEQFIRSNRSLQIISLGAGYDSLYWRIKASLDVIVDEGEPKPSINYVEIDMGTVTLHKLMAIKRHPKLLDSLTNVTFKGEGLHSDDYHLISFDLRQVDKESLRRKLFEECQLDPNKPTLCIAECVLIYMPTQDSASLINWLGSKFENLTMLNYEQCNMRDRFGDIMLENMNVRHCDLMGVDACTSLQSQETRFTSNGIKYTKIWTLSDIFNNLIAPGEIERIEKLEFLDEKELLMQLLQHYCIILASHKPIDWIVDEQYWLAKSLT